MNLIPLAIEAEGVVKSSNLCEFKSAFFDWVSGIKCKLVTDEDFDQASSDIKTLQAAEKSLDAALQAVIDGMGDISMLQKSVGELKAEASLTRLTLTKLVEKEKEHRRAAIISEAAKGLPYSAQARLANAARGKRTLESIKAAATAEASIIEAEATEVANYVTAAGGDAGEVARLKYGGMATAEASMQRRAAVAAEAVAKAEAARLAETEKQRLAAVAAEAVAKAEAARLAETEKQRLADETARRGALAAKVAEAVESAHTPTEGYALEEEETLEEEMLRYKAAVRAALGGLKAIREGLLWLPNIESAKVFAGEILDAFKKL